MEHGAGLRGVAGWLRLCILLSYFAMPVFAVASEMPVQNLIRQYLNPIFSIGANHQASSSFHDMVPRDFLRVMRLISEKPETEPKFNIDGHDIVVGAHRLRITTVVENNGMTRNGELLLGVRYDVAIDGEIQPLLTTGSVGFGSTAENVTEEVTVNWYMCFGKALMTAASGDPPSFRHAGLDVFDGAMQAIGVPADVLTRDRRLDQRTIFAAIFPHLPPSDERLHAVHCYMKADADGIVKGALCRIDGVPSPSATQAFIDHAGTDRGLEMIIKQEFIFR
jgi:hypothetical protein